MRTNYIRILLRKFSINKRIGHAHKLHNISHSQDFYKKRYSHEQELHYRSSHAQDFYQQRFWSCAWFIL